MATDPTPDALERIGREHAKRLGVEPRKDWCEYGWDGRLPDALGNIVGDKWHIKESSAYIALGRAVVACELAIGLADRVREAVEAEREANITTMDAFVQKYPGIDHLEMVVEEFADAIRGRKGEM